MPNLYFKTISVFIIISFFTNSLLFGQIINNQNSTSSSALTLPTCGAITPPYLETFDNSFFYDANDPKSLDSCWFQTDFDLLDSIGVSYNSSSFTEHKEWFKNGFGNVGDTGAISLRVTPDIPNTHLLITPSLNMGTILDTFTLEFDLTFTDTAANIVSTLGSSFGCFQTFKVLFSEDDGDTWNLLNEFDELVFDVNNIPDFPTQHYSLMLRNPMDFEIFSGNIRLGFFFFDFPGFFPCDDVFDIHLDNFEISDDVVYEQSADIFPNLGALPLVINNAQTYKALDQICVGEDTAVDLLYSINNNGPYTSLGNQTYIFNSVGDTIVDFVGGNTAVSGAWTFFEDVENICPGILDSAYTCDVQMIMYSTNPSEADHSNDTLNFQIVSHETPDNFQINEDTTICEGNSVMLNGTSSVTVTWKDGFGNTYSNGDLVSPTTTTTYFAKAGTGICAIDDQFKITIASETLEITLNGTTLNATAGFDSYEWKLNGSVVGNSSSLTISVNGTYTVTATKIGCDFEEEIDVMNVSIDDINPMTESIYPNPFKTSFTIPVEFECADIYNVKGQIVLSTSNNLVNVSDLPSGLYNIIIHTENGIYQQKIIKN